MPPLPLYDPAPPHPDGWHRVTAPGGYESWHFDAEDDAGGVRVVAMFSLGCPHDVGYQRRAAAFFRRPTRVHPPRPIDYPAVVFAVYEKGELLAMFAERHRRDAFEASADHPDVRIGPNQLLGNAAGTLSLRFSSALAMAGRFPVGRLNAELWFAPRTPPVPAISRTCPSRDAGGADHRWIIAAPHCEVTGTIRLGGTAAVAAREMHLTGRGYHDHEYGSGPAGAGMRWLIRGRVLRDDRAVCFRIALPEDPGVSVEAHCARADASGISCEDRVEPVTIGRGWPMPSVIRLGDILTLREPILLERWPRSLWVEYQVEGEGSALVETVFSQRKFSMGASSQVLPLDETEFTVD